MSPRPWHLLFLAALAVLAAVPAWAAVRAADHGKFGRLVLEWNDPVVMRHSPTEAGMRLELSRPVEGDLNGAVAKLPGWLQGVEASPRGSELDLALPSGVTADIVGAGANRVVLDFKRRGAVQARGLETARHPGFGRMVVEAPPGRVPTLSREGDVLTIEAGIVWSPDAVRRAAELGPPVDKVHGEASRLVVSLLPGTQVQRQESDRRRLVLDLRPAAPLATPVPEPLAAPEDEERQPAAGPPSHPGGSAAALPGLVDGGSTPRLSAKAVGDAVELELAWPEPVPAASFVRAGRLWLVFGHPAGELTPSSVTGVSERLHSLTLHPHPEATVLTVASDGTASMTRRGAAWIVRLGGGAETPKSAVAWPPVDGELRIDGAAALAEVEDPVVGDRLGVAMLLEPGRGEPLGREAVGLELLPTLQGAAWHALADDVTASSRPSGVTISLPALAANPHHPSNPAAGHREQAPSRPTAVAAESRQGTDPPPADAEPAPASPEAAVPVAGAHGSAPAHTSASSAAPDSRRPGGPVDLAAGVLPAGQTARDRRRRLEQAVLDATGAEQALRRIDLARMLLAQELAAEAAASLAPLDTGDPAQPAASALAGIAAYLRGQLDEASRQLGRPWLDGDAEVALWRAAVASSRHDRPTALREWRRSGGIPASYPNGLRVRLGIVGAGIELSDGRTDAALALLDRLRDLPKSPEAEARIRLAEAPALEAQGASGKADAALADALARGDRDTRLEAQRLRIEWDLRQGRITAEAALARLEAMRPAWRGHPDEIGYLDQIARLRARNGDLSAAVAAWEEALADASNPRAKDELRQGLREQVAGSLLGEGDGPPLSPLESLLVYRRHGDWLPRGAALAEVERRLAARLARAGIETPAERLLHRRLDLAGSAEARADAGVALAESRLAARDPGSALALLRSTGPERGLPAALAAQRSDMRTRAAAATGAAGDGETDGTPTDRLRAAWEARDWERIETLSADLLASPAEAEGDRPGAILGLALAQARRGDGAALAEIGRDHSAELPSRRDRALLAMLAAGTQHPAAGAADLAPVEAGIGAVRTYLQTPE